MINPKHIQSNGYTVIITEGGVTVMCNPGDYTSPNLRPSKNTNLLTEKELQDIADAAVKEWEEFAQMLEFI